MKNINTTTFYANSKNVKVPNSIFKQELVTWENTKNGIKKTTVIRSFNDNGYLDNYISEPFAFGNSNTWVIKKKRDKSPSSFIT